jgi:hypothetical protein
MVEISNNAGAPYRVLITDNKGEFFTQFQFYWETDEVKHFTVTLRISKKGFQPAHKYAEIKASPTGEGIAVTLRAIKPEDPTLLSQADLIKAIAPRLRQLGPAEGLSPKQDKDYARGVQEFLDRNHVDSAVPILAKVSGLNRDCLRCRTMLALAELSWADWDDARREMTEAVNTMLENPARGVAEPFIVAGELMSWDQGPAKASAYFTEALKYSPQDVFALQEHGRMQCLNLDWESASVSLKKALAGGAPPEAELMYAEALMWTATPEEAEAEMNLYLGGRNPKSMPPRVRGLWDRIESAKKDRTIMLAAKEKAEARGEQPLDYIHHPPKDLPDFTPAADQAQLDAILNAVGRNVSDLFTNLPNISSMEAIHQEKLTRKGKTDTAQQFKYRYLMLAPDQPWGPGIDEHRADAKGNETPQLGLSDNSMLTSGFVSAPLIFHPAYQKGSIFRLLGQQKVKDRNTYVIVYAQDPAKSRLAGSFQQGNITKMTYTQGIAWVDAENYQIIRLTTDLLAPLPMVKLDKETTDINFSQVQFNHPAQKFWLPEAVTVTLDWNGKLLRNQHAYSDFMVFNVDSSQKIGKPKNAENTTEEPPAAAAGPNPLENNSLSLVPPAKVP